jgi:hypothetical protein
MSDSTRLAVTLGLSRSASFEPASELSAHIIDRGPADALRALATHRVLLEAASVPLQLAAGSAAPAETRAPARDAAATLLEIIFATEPWLMPEALALLGARGLRLPHAALAGLLHTTDATLRTLIAKVAGERGRWLAQTLNEYAWLLQIARSEDVIELKTSFDEGLLAEREAALREWRSVDSAAARSALQAAFAQEKADVRVRLLTALEVELSAGDTPWLESLLQDRAPSVQQAARALLLTLPGSGMRQRNRAVLAASLRIVANALTLHVPERWPDALAVDGLTAPLSAQAPARAFTIRVLAAVTEPLDWFELSALTVHEFVAALLACDFYMEVLEGWMRPFVHQSAPQAQMGELAEALLAALLVQARNPAFAAHGYPHKNMHKFFRTHLLKMLDGAAWQRLWPALARDPDMQYHAFNLVPKPWAAAIAEQWLTQLTTRLADVTPASNAASGAATDSLAQQAARETRRSANVAAIEFELGEARVGLAVAQFPAALAIRLTPEHACFDAIDQFQRALALRVRLFDSLSE